MTQATTTPNARPTHKFTGPISDKQSIVKTICLTEADIDRGLDDKGQPKREIVLTCIQEGRGNERDRRWYLAEAVKGVEKQMYARRKLFVDHLTEAQKAAGQTDPLQNWVATMKKTWVEEGKDGQTIRKIRVKIHEDWLWKRCEEAPEEIALSIEGRGAGRQGEIAGEQYMLIERIYHLDAFKFVTYPGNAAMGADLVEGEARPDNPTEESPMDLTTLTVEELRKARPDMVIALTEEAAKAAKADAEKKAQTALTEAAAAKGDVAAIKGQLQEEFKAALSEQAKAQAGVIDTLTAKLNEAERKVEAAAVRDAIAARKSIVDRCLNESKLPVEARTPRFLDRLASITERKAKDADGKDKTITIEEQVKAEIQEQEVLVGVAKKDPTVAKVVEGAAPAVTPAADDKDADLTEEEIGVLHRHANLGGPSLEEFRKSKKAA